MNAMLLRARHLPLKKIAACVVAAALATGAVTAIAVEDTGTRSASSAECNSFRAATQNAMQNQLAVVNQFMTGAAGQMQAAVSKNNSCIGNLALLDFDLSKLIPDFGLVGVLLQKAIDSLVQGVINRACAAVTDVLDKPGEIWNGVVGQLNISGQFQDWSRGMDYKVQGLGSGSGSATGGRSTPTTPIGGVSEAPKGCVETPAGTICTDGSTSAAVSNPQSLSGTQIGTQFGYLSNACTSALAQDENNQIAPTPTTIAACRSMQSFADQYRAYIDPSQIPKLPDFNATPADSEVVNGSWRSPYRGKSANPEASSFSLPVRQ
ncbi:hypothetical protein [Paracidovorax wautersii]|uniref:Uncharacterized protein n=1 Tax=Paracidovorax wautersii TaxID=1177982 RepID=A0A1I2HNZ7_9BURK|nr:hypothetical protein [Paracidovorax wautersii]SFF31529.1 hypothetical protein SAMN04489711_1274 [Paracidovorax wautersii]